MEITYKFFMIRHGLPTATTLAGMSFVTTLPAPITVLSPMVTPARMMAPAPIQQLLPMRIGWLTCYPCSRREGSVGCVPAAKIT